MFEILFDAYKAPYEKIPLGHQGETEARCLIWDVSPYIEEFGRGGVQVKVTQPETGIVYMATNVNLVQDQAKWTLTDVDTAKAGDGLCELYYTDQSGNVLAKSHVMRFFILPTQGDAGDTPSPYEDLIDTIAEYAASAQTSANTASTSAARAKTSADYAASVVDEKVSDEAYIRATNDAGLQGQINSLMGAVGSPLVAPLASVMSDTDRIYVYTGNETGYTNGNWYYYNGTAWVSGGVYNSTALETDKTLTASDMAADAKVTGDRVGAILDTFETGKSYGGDIVTFDDGVVGSPLKDLVVNITPKQASGTPRPDNVLPITGWTEANITRTGKNLVNENNWYSGHTISATGVITENGSFKCSNAYMGILPNTKYTLQLDKNTTSDSGLSAGTFIAEYDASFNFLRRTQIIAGGTTTGTITGTYTSHASARFAKVSVYIGSINVQLEEGSTATEYESYNGNTYNISFGDAGTAYSGTLDVMTGTLTVDRKLITYNGSEYWWSETSGSYVGTNFYIRKPSDAYSSTDATPYVCNVAQCASTFIQDGCTVSINYLNFIFGNALGITAVADWKTWLASHNIQMVYPLAQPVTYNLTPSEVSVLMGTNHVWADTGSIKSLEYRKNDHGEEYALKAFPTATTSGGIAFFADGADGVPLKDLVVNITPVQSGTGDPSPTNVRAISGWTEANITQTGKNLLKSYASTQTVNGLTYTVNPDKSITVSGTSTASTSFNIMYGRRQELKAGVTYYFHGCNVQLNGSISKPAMSADIVYTAQDGDYVSQIWLWFAANSTPSKTFYPSITVVPYNDASYAPYNETVYNISFGSAGTVYGGTLDVTTGMLTVTGALIDLGTLTWNFWYVNRFYATLLSVKRQGYVVCEKYRTATANVDSGVPPYIFTTSAASALYIRDDSYAQDASGAAQLKADLSGVHAVYELAQPISYQLTPTEVKTLLANNNIFADTGSVASCEYRADTRLYIEKLTNPDDDMVANANITSGQYFMVGNNLYLATANIANGGAITPGTNCTATNLAAALNAINS